jgi:hypothetical protein
MRSTFHIAFTAAVAALILTSGASSSHAATCETQLKPRYKCTASYDDGQTSEYCLTADVETPDDGKFWMVEALTVGFECACQAKGRAPNLDFGGSRDFLCISQPDLAVAGRVSGARMTGQGFSLGFSVQSAFSCQAVETCP